MQIGDLVIYKFDTPLWKPESEIDWGYGVIISRIWNDDAMIWENTVWFSKMQEHVLCDDVDLQFVA